MMANYDLHGIVGVRVEGATPGEAATLAERLGLSNSPANAEADLIIRFVDQIERSRPERYLGLDDAAFSDEGFRLIQGRHGQRAAMEVAFDSIGKQSTLEYERAFKSRHLLLPMFNLAVLHKGVLPLHAAAFNYRGRGILTTGWSKSGKTETLLAFMANGAEFVGDEYIYLDGRKMYGARRPVTLWEWHLDELTQFASATTWRERGRLATLRFVVRALDWSMARGIGSDFRTAEMMAWANRRLSTKMDPVQLFGPSKCAFEGEVGSIFLLMNWESPQVEVRKVDSMEVAQRMFASHQHQRLYLMAQYLKFKFAFPERVNLKMEKSEKLEWQLLQQFFQNKETYAVYHPYPVSMQSLFVAMRDLLR